MIAEHQWCWKGQKISHDTNDDDNEKNESEGFDSNKLRLTLSIQDTRLCSIFSQSIRIELIMTMMMMTFTMISMTMMMATMPASGVVVPVKPGSSLIIWHPKPFPRLQWFLVCNIIFIIFPNTVYKYITINQAWVCLRFWHVNKYIEVKDLQDQIYVNSSSYKWQSRSGIEGKGYPTLPIWTMLKETARLIKWGIAKDGRILTQYWLLIVLRINQHRHQK